MKQIIFWLKQPQIGERWHDGGPVYAESDFSHFIVEPWNCVTAFMFLGIVLYWFVKLRSKLLSMPFMLFALTMLFIGGVGGGLYHGLRTSNWFLLMDFMPIVILVFSTGVLFLNRLYGKPWLTWGIILLLFALHQIIWLWIGPGPWMVNIGYMFLAAVVIVPSILWAKRTRFFAIKTLGMAVVFFSIALTFRILDKYYLLPMGTHFLWHTFGAFASSAMVNYIYQTVYAHPSLVFGANRRLLEMRLAAKSAMAKS
jgi:hemolysin III